MAGKIAPEALKSLLDGSTPFALIDVREAGEYNSSHIPGSSLIPRRQLEFQVPHAVPYKGTHVVVCDDDGRRAGFAAATVERMGYREVSVLDGGINRWVTDGLSTEWGMNVPSKDFGEKVEVVHHVPEIEAKELAARIQKGEKLVILDTRTPEEFRRFCIPGGRSVPGGELALRITDIARNLDKDTTIIVNCAGRTRSIIGTRVLQRMGIPKVYGLKNGTSGWVLAGHQLETGADRVDLPAPSADAVAAADAYIAVMDAKYHYEFWRPITAIRNGDLDDNPATERDPTWQPLGATPMHPEYPCAHCIHSAALAAVVETIFGTADVPELVLTSTTAPGVTHRWTNMWVYANEVADARIFAGFHYRFSNRVGQDMGRKIGEHAVKNVMQPVSGAGAR